MPRTILDPTAAGTLSQWDVVGTSAWQAVAKASGDTTYIYTNTPANITDLYCGSGWAPNGGRIVAVTLHYRMKRTTAFPASIDFAITQSTVSRAIGTVNITTDDWVDGHIRVRADWTSAVRFTRAEVVDLGVEVTANTVPTGGYLMISQLWLAVEYLDTYMVYDPFEGVTPDAALGDKIWLATGTEPYSINLDNYLEIDDTSAVAFGAFIYQQTPLISDEYITEFELRVRLSNAGAGNIPFGDLCALLSSHLVVLIPVRFAGINYLGIPYNSAGRGVITNYLDIQPFDFLAEDFHIHIIVDRDPDPSTYGKVQCFIDYADTPLLEVNFNDLIPTSPVTEWIGFGTDSTVLTSTIKMEIDYFAWRHYLKRGDAFRAFHDVICSTNTVYADSTDLDIVKPIMIDPPGITAGQSQHCGCLDVQDPTADCGVYQIKLLPQAAPVTYKLDVEYKMDSVGVEGEVTVQRASDLWYWDEGTSLWQAAFSSVTLLNSTIRAVANAMTAISTTDTADPIIVKIQRATAVLPAYKIFLYRVYLAQNP